MFGRSDAGKLVLVSVAEGAETVHYLGQFGPDSYATQAPTDPPELYLETVWPADRNGNVAEEGFCPIFCVRSG